MKGDIWLAGSILSTSGGNITIKVDNDEVSVFSVMPSHPLKFNVDHSRFSPRI